jgi:hypothetical protein
MTSAPAKPVTDVQVQGMTLKMNADGAWPELAGRPHEVLPGQLVDVAFLLDATAGHQAALIIKAELPDRTVLLEFTWRSFAMVARSYAARYGWPD